MAARAERECTQQGKSALDLAWLAATPQNGRPARAKDRPGQMTDGFVVPMKPGNAGGGKGPCFETKDRRGNSLGD